MNILIAHDEAFNFTYRANIDALRQLGEVSFFSPLRDTTFDSKLSTLHSSLSTIHNTLPPWWLSRTLCRTTISQPLDA